MDDERIPPNQQLVKGDRWPVVGEREPQKTDDPWTLTICGTVTHEVQHRLDDLRDRPMTRRSIDVHCVTRWSKLGMSFGGIPLSDLILPDGQRLWSDEARYVSFVARSDRRHSTSLPLARLLELDPLVAFQADGRPLASEHGGPIRMVVPGRYFYKSVKWLERIEFLAEDRLGYWEADAGYHNDADPWKEQRYIASQLGKQEAADLIRRKDFSHRNLLSLHAAGLDLSGLNAEDAALRNADFQRAVLRKANFAGANLSNARFDRSDLRQADFRGADLEGADLTAADLRGADLTGTSLFGATFGRMDSNGLIIEAAKVDASTTIDPRALEALAPEQREAVFSDR